MSKNSKRHEDPEMADPSATTTSTASEVTTTRVGRSGNTVEVVHDRERCYGYLRPWGPSLKAWWSGERFDDHYIGEFTTKAAAIDAVVNDGHAGRDRGRDQEPLKSQDNTGRSFAQEPLKPQDNYVAEPAVIVENLLSAHIRKKS